MPATTLNIVRCGQGEPLILIHGIGGELCVWEPVMDVLAERFDTIAVDLPGFGGSPPLPDGVSPAPAALAAAIGGLMDELGLASAHLAGNSLGGWVALELGTGHRARSITAICPAGLWERPLRTPGAPGRGGAQRLARRLGPLLSLLMFSRRFRRLALGNVVGDPDRVPRDAARRMVRSYGRAPAYAATNIAMREGFFTGAEEIGVPLTVAYGERDRMIRPVRLPVPGARITVLPGCGHIPMWDRPDLVTALIAETADVGRVAAR